MKLKELNEITSAVVMEAADMTQDVYDIYTKSVEVEQLTIGSKQIGGVLTMARTSTYAAFKLMDDVKLLRKQQYMLYASIGIFGSYYVYNEFIKDSKLMKRIKNENTK